MFDQKRYVNEFIKDHYRAFKIRVRNEDEVMLRHLEGVPNLNAYILKLVEEDIRRSRTYPFIDPAVSIDFALSRTMQELVDAAEKADILGDYGLYMNLADAIDSQGKKETSKHLLSESQWKQLTKRYRP